MIKVSTTKKSELGVLDSLKAMTLSKPERRKLLNKAARRAVRGSRKNQRQQKSPSGVKWEKRRKKSKKKMQVRLAQLMTVTSNNTSQATIGWKKADSARVAAKHHYGNTTRCTRAAAIKALRNGNKRSG